MRLPFFDPRGDEVAAIATDLITRFGLHAHNEASYLAELSVQMHSRRDRVFYELVAREIDASFLEAQRRLGLRQSASDAAHSFAKDTKAAIAPSATEPVGFIGHWLTRRRRRKLTPA
jgi:hypothetical protein